MGWIDCAAEKMLKVDQASSWQSSSGRTRNHNSVAFQQSASDLVALVAGNGEEQLVETVGILGTLIG